jgi:phosphate-selective porin OprO/OprP
VKKACLSVFVLIAFLSVLAIPVMAAEPSTEVEQLKGDVQKLLNRIQELEKKQAESESKVKETQKKFETVEKAATKLEQEEAKLKEEKKQRAIAYYRDGFFIETPDKQFRLQLAGVLHFDTRIFEGGGKSATSLDIRRARYDMRGSLYKGDIEHVFRLQIEMADTPYLRNAYWMFKFRPELNIQVGQFKIPAGGADFLTEEAQVNFIEYATDSPVTPFFDRGINIHSSFLDGKIQTNIGVFTGVGLDADVGQGDWDTNKDYAARLLLVPFKGSENKFVKGLHFAGSYQDGLQSIKTVRGETNNRTENYESRWYRWKQPFVDLSDRRRYGGEFHWLVGPVTLSYEFNRVEWEDLTVYRYKGTYQNFTPSYKTSEISGSQPYPGRYHSDVHQVWISYFLTGEEKTFEDVFFAWRQPKPKKNFSLKEGTWGAWEIIARYAYHETSKELFTPVTVGTDNQDATLLEGSSRGHSITGGIRWIWNPKTRLMFDVNYLKSDRGSGIQVLKTDGGTFDTNAPSARGFKDSETALLMRLILTP